MATGIGTRIKRARERKRWTQRELAAALKVSIKTVDNWENNRTSPKNSVGALEEVLGVNLGEEPEQPDIMPPGLRESIRNLVISGELSPEEAGRVEAAVEAALRGGPMPPTRRHGE